MSMFGSGGRARRVLVASCAAVLVAMSMSACSTEPADEFTRSYFEDATHGEWGSMCGKLDDSLREYYKNEAGTCEAGVQRVYYRDGSTPPARITVDASRIGATPNTDTRVTFRRCDVLFDGEPLHEPFHEVTVTDEDGGWRVTRTDHGWAECDYPSPDVVLVGHPVTG